MVFVETRPFTDRVLARLSEEDYTAFQNALIANPEVGVVIRGGGGLRKVRWKSQGKGKSGGVRVIYYWAVIKDRFLMLDIYGKGERSDLSAAELKILRRLMEVWNR